MASYEEQLNAIRAAREGRDEARADLHKQLLEQLKLLRVQRKADSKETTVDAATLAAMQSLAERISAAMAKLREVEAKLAAIARLQSELQQLQALLNSLAAERDQLQERLALVESELNSPDLTPERRVKLEAERAALLAKLEALKSRIGKLRDQIAELERQLRDAEGQRAELEQERERLQSEINRLQRELDHLAESGRGFDDRTEDINRGREGIAGQRTNLKDRESVVGGLIEGLFRDLPPQRLIENWSDSTPIMLLPLRLETIFKDTDRGEQLWVRVYPDEVAVTTHEKILTERELDFGVAYWKALRGATDEEVSKKAWRTLADRFGANRAAWIALQTKPLNWSTPPPASDDLLTFPVIETTQIDSWSEAPHSVVMPDRFVLLAYRGGELIHTEVGKQISDRLVVGPAPLEDEDKPSITRDPVDNRLQYADDFKWLLDFPLAVDSGMGFRVALDAVDSHSGFDQLLVIGLKLTANEADGQRLVEELIDNHHYSTKGFSLVKQGSATNNTD